MNFLALVAALLFPATMFSQAVSAAPIAADSRISAMLSTLGRTRTPTDAAISPDGMTVAWAARTGTSGAEIHLTAITSTGSVDDAREQIVTAGEDCNNNSPIWSPDGQSLAFLAACPSQQTRNEQLYLWQKNTGSTRQITHLTGDLQMPMWSPDGKQIAFLFVENATRNAGALAPMKPWNGVYGEDGVEVQRVAAVEIEGAAFYFVTPASLHVYEYTWDPNSYRIAFIAAEPPGENNWWIARLYILGGVVGPLADATIYKAELNRACGLASKTGVGCGLSHGSSAGPIAILDVAKSGPLHNLQIAVPRFSPDGQRIAFLGGLMSDEGSNGGDIYLLSDNAGPLTQPIDITPNRTGSPAYFTWLDNHTLKVSERANGSTRIFDYDVDKHTESNVLTLPESVSANSSFVFSVSVSSNNHLAMIRSSFSHPPEVWAGPANSLQQITHLNDSLAPAWGKSESIEWDNEGQHVQGWLLYPANYDSTKRYPLITFIHGGPSNASTPRWPSVGYGGVPFAGLGYFVFFPNPRGSFGQGERFTQANIRDFGYGDLSDILTGVDAVEKRVPIDKSREGLTGWSYGGYMTMFAVTQTQRFHAAVAGAGIANYQSYYGQNSIDQWLLPFFGASVYDDPTVYARSSPITFIKQVKTPTLLVVGDRDGECPAPQSFEFWHALHDLGVKTQLVIYPNEGHSFQQPAHREDVLARALRWFQEQMPAQ